MSNLIMRLIDTDEIGDASVSQLLHNLDVLEPGKQSSIAITASHQFQPHAAFICLQGPHTERYLEAIRQVSRDITLEQRYGAVK